MNEIRKGCSLMHVFMKKLSFSDVLTMIIEISIFDLVEIIIFMKFSEKNNFDLLKK